MKYKILMQSGKEHTLDTEHELKTVIEITVINDYVEIGKNKALNTKFIESIEVLND